MTTSEIPPVYTMEYPGVWRLMCGEPERFTPVRLRAGWTPSAALNELPAPGQPPIDPAQVIYRTTSRSCVVQIPLDASERLYGLGLHLTSLSLNERRTALAVNDHQDYADGSSHAPVPFYVSTRGYGILIDTYRSAHVFCGVLKSKRDNAVPDKALAPVAVDTESLYERCSSDGRYVTVDIPVSAGVDLYIFAGPAMVDAVCRYNLFSGGGCLPPVWGLGVWYRGYSRHDSGEALAQARSFREAGLPCTVYGLEPGWQSRAYSCSFTWSEERWPNHADFIDEMIRMGYQVNLWEHAFTHPTAPFHAQLSLSSGDYLVWEGLVPDFADPQACTLFGAYHTETFVRAGISSFKLDECDHQPHEGVLWTFPDFSQYPSGLDGEQMHGHMGVGYQRVLTEAFMDENLRTYGQVRSSHALAAPLPFVLYSDAYDHRDFVRGILNAGFCGLLWQPELREADSREELLRRLGTAVCSPQTVVNAWCLPKTPWQQLADKHPAKWQTLEREVKDLLQLRMRLVPYLYSAFVDYHQRGIPPFRALVLDYPDDQLAAQIDDEYMMGSAILVAPLFGAEETRTVYLPSGSWHCFWAGTILEGAREHKVSMPPEHIPLFVKDGAILPLAAPLHTITPDTVFEITAHVFGDGALGTDLYADDGVSLDFNHGGQCRYAFSWDRQSGGQVRLHGEYATPRYKVVHWVHGTGA